MIQVVARYRDGRLVKGTTINFSPDAWSCHIQPCEAPYGEGTRIEFRDLKAIFFVRDLDGNPYRSDAQTFDTRARFATPVRVRFADGEEIVGLANPSPEMHEAGFFIYPADARSNNERVFAIRGFIESVTALDEEALGAGGAEAALAAGDAREAPQFELPEVAEGATGAGVQAAGEAPAHA